MSGVLRDNVERRVLAVLRPVIIVLLLVVCLFPFYYMLLLSFRSLDAVLQDPGALWPGSGEIDLGTYKDVLTSTENGGHGFLTLLPHNAGVGRRTVAVTPLV